MRVKLSDRSCTAFGAVGRKTRRAGRLASTLDLYAPVLSRAVDTPPRCGCVTSRPDDDSAHPDNLVGLAHARNGSKPARSNLKEVNGFLGAPSFSPYRA